MKAWLLMLPLVALGVVLQEEEQIGQTVELPSITDASGQPVDWSKSADKSLLLFFHKQGMAYSERGLERLLEQLQKDQEARLHSRLFVVVFSEDGAEALRQQVEAAKVGAKVLVDPQHLAFKKLKVIAFPTCFVAGLDRTILHVAKGYAPQQAVQLTVAARYGAGLMDEASYRALEAGELAPSAVPDKKLRRHVHLAARMAAAGKVEEALADLSKAWEARDLKAAMDPLALELLCRLQLALDQVEAASKTLATFAEAFPQEPMVELLQVRWLIQAGQLDQAEQALGAIRARLHPEATMLKGMLAEKREQYKESALLYRRLLQQEILQKLGGL